MAHVLLLSLLSLSPAESRMVAALSAPKFAVRERASADLKATMTYPLALKLERAANGSEDPEQRRRLQRLVDGYWSDAYLEGLPAPYIDALSTKPCWGCHTPLTRHYFDRAGYRQLLWPEGQWGQFRDATSVLLADCQAWRVPPFVVRPLVRVMRTRSEKYDLETARPALIGPPK